MVDKALVDATSPTMMAPMLLKRSVVKLTLSSFGAKVLPAGILNVYNRFKIVSIRHIQFSSPQILGITQLRLTESIFAVFKTFPSGYHESAKQRPTEGQIFPRKRNKNY